jgi:hypothetical protein
MLRDRHARAEWSSGQFWTGKGRKPGGWVKTGVDRTNAGQLDELTTDKQKTQGIMGKMADTWRGVETSTLIGETDQGVTMAVVISAAVLFKHSC